METKTVRTHYEVESVRIIPEAGVAIEDIGLEATLLAISMNVAVCFNFNGCEVRVHPRDVAKIIEAQWDEHQRQKNPEGTA